MFLHSSKHTSCFFLCESAESEELYTMYVKTISLINQKNKALKLDNYLKEFVFLKQRFIKVHILEK
jgi:hypothetical protein